MKILFVSDVSIQDVIGGAERMLYEQTTRLALRGHDVHILTRKLPSHRSGEETIQNVREWRYNVNMDNPVSFFASTLYNGKRLFEKVNRANNFDCINFHQPFSAFAVIRAASSKEIKKIYTCHSLAFEEYLSRNPKPESFSGEILYSLQVVSRRWIEKRVLTEADAVVVLSRYTLDKLQNIYRLPPEKVALIPGGIDLERFRPASDRTAIRESLNLPLNKTILLTIRNLVQRMGLENLIIAMQEIVKTLPDIYLVIGGAGPLKDELISLSRRLHVDQYINFTGFISEDDLPAYYRAADIFVLPTIELEGFGLVTLEALASGIPVLGTPVGGTKEILSKLEGRFLFKDTSFASISALVIEICGKYRDNPGKWKDDSKRCRQFAEENYSWTTNVVKTEALFLESTVKKSS